MVSIDTILRRSDAILHSDVGDKVVMMDLDEGAYYGLNRIAARIWTLLETPTSVSAICDKLCAEYAVDRATCEREVLAFATELLGRNVLVAPASPAEPA